MFCLQFGFVCFNYYIVGVFLIFWSFFWLCFALFSSLFSLLDDDDGDDILLQIRSHSETLTGLKFRM